MKLVKTKKYIYGSVISIIKLKKGYMIVTSNYFNLFPFLCIEINNIKTKKEAFKLLNKLGGSK